MRKALIGAAAIPLALGLLMPTNASAIDDVNTKKLRTAVTVNGILQHERALQRIANENDGTRASGTPGYDASADYVAQKLRQAGYKVTVQEFTFPFFRVPAARRERADHADADRVRDSDARVLRQWRRDRRDHPDHRHRDPADPGAEQHVRLRSLRTSSRRPPAPAIALIQRGTCTLEQKVANAEAAGYDAVLFFNEGQPGRTEIPPSPSARRPPSRSMG